MKYNEVIYVFFQKESQTAGMCAFLRAHHLRINAFPIFDDPMCRALPEELYLQIYDAITQNKGFFTGDHLTTEAVINRYLAGEVVARTAFHHHRLRTAVQLGARQVVQLGAGLDFTGYGQGTLPRPVGIFEVDRAPVLGQKAALLAQMPPAYPVVSVAGDVTGEDWANCLVSAGFNPWRRAYFSMFGLSQYLDRTAFDRVVRYVSLLAAPGSTLALDWDRPAPHTRALAGAAGAPMAHTVKLDQVIDSLRRHGFLIYEQMERQQVPDTYLLRYNEIYPEKPLCLPGEPVFILAVRQE